MTTYDKRDWYEAKKCQTCSDSGWWYPSEHAIQRNEVIRCPKCYPSDRMRRAENAPDRFGEHDRG